MTREEAWATARRLSDGGAQAWAMCVCDLDARLTALHEARLEALEQRMGRTELAAKDVEERLGAMEARDASLDKWGRRISALEWREREREVRDCEPPYDTSVSGPTAPEPTRDKAAGVMQQVDERIEAMTAEEWREMTREEQVQALVTEYTRRWGWCASDPDDPEYQWCDAKWAGLAPHEQDEIKRDPRFPHTYGPDGTCRPGDWVEVRRDRNWPTEAARWYACNHDRVVRWLARDEGGGA